MKVLLIEPDILSAKLYADVLVVKGHEVRTVGSAQHALDSLDADLPDCIVLELDLKLHNGFEFLYEFCSQADWKHIPIILHTGVSPNRFRNMHVSWDELNVVEYLYKPTSSLVDLQDSVSSSKSISSN